MYAYQRQSERNYYNAGLHVVKPVQKRQQTIHKIVKRKKVNPITKLVRLAVVLSSILSFMYFVYPTCYNNLIKQVISPNKINITTSTNLSMAHKNWKPEQGVDLYSLVNPTTNYLNNAFLIFSRGSCLMMNSPISSA